jgi:hypothetical protein
MVGSRILLIPIIAAIGYEILRFGARHRTNPIVRAVMLPGILVQKITTRQPTDDMIEVAIVSMEQALEADGEPLPEGSGTLERAPLPPPGAGLRPTIDPDAADGAPPAQHPTTAKEAETVAPVTIDPPIAGV